MRAYDMRALIHTMADTDAKLEIRQGFGLGMITALIRVEGRPSGWRCTKSWCDGI
jgi:acetyl-CoA carboxylase carboxyltransferase component